MELQKKARQMLSNLGEYLRKRPVSAAVFILGVLYSTLFIEYIDESYFDLFSDDRVRMVIVVAVAFASYADPRNGVVLLVAMLRTFKYVRKAENFGLGDIERMVKDVKSPEWMKKEEDKKSESDSESDSDPDIVELENEDDYLDLE